MEFQDFAAKRRKNPGFPSKPAIFKNFFLRRLRNFSRTKQNLLKNTVCKTVQNTVLFPFVSCSLPVFAWKNIGSTFRCDQVSFLDVRSAHISDFGGWAGRRTPTQRNPATALTWQSTLSITFQCRILRVKTQIP